MISPRANVKEGDEEEGWRRGSGSIWKSRFWRPSSSEKKREWKKEGEKEKEGKKEGRQQEGRKEATDKRKLFPPPCFSFLLPLPPFSLHCPSMLACPTSYPFCSSRFLASPFSVGLGSTFLLLFLPLSTVAKRWREEEEGEGGGDKWPDCCSATDVGISSLLNPQPEKNTSFSRNKERERALFLSEEPTDVRVNFASSGKVSSFSIHGSTRTYTSRSYST